MARTQPTSRARKSEDKQERRELLLQTALDLYAHSQYAEIAMADIAEAAGLAKGTVYLYFKTKEELFLALLDRELDGWFADMGAAIGGYAGAWSARVLADKAARTLDQRHALRRLVAMVGVILEHNVDYDAALAFKQRLAERAQAAGAMIEHVLPFVKPGEGKPVILRLYALVIGVQQLCEPAPVMRAVLARPELAEFRLDFRTTFQECAQLLLEGMQKQVRVAVPEP
jgi:AcrR family transcriptional regulator